MSNFASHRALGIDRALRDPLFSVGVIQQVFEAKLRTERRFGRWYTLQEQGAQLSRPSEVISQPL